MHLYCVMTSINTVGYVGNTGGKENLVPHNIHQWRPLSSAGWRRELKAATSASWKQTIISSSNFVLGTRDKWVQFTFCKTTWFVPIWQREDSLILISPFINANYISEGGAAIVLHCASTKEAYCSHYSVLNWGYIV